MEKKSFKKKLTLSIPTLTKKKSVELLVILASTVTEPECLLANLNPTIASSLFAVLRMVSEFVTLNPLPSKSCAIIHSYNATAIATANPFVAAVADAHAISVPSDVKT